MAALEIVLEDQPFDLAFHPSSSLVVAGLITGKLQLFKFGEELNEAQSSWNVEAHSESCRAVRFAEDGLSLLSASPDRSILATNVETGQAVARLENAHGCAINRLINLSENIVASGDDDGTIKVWDTRQNSCCNVFNPHDEYISDMEFVVSTLQILGTSGDGTLSVCNLRRNKVDARSEFSEDELLSVVLVKDGRKIICGSQDGVLLLYSWPHFKDCSDRFVGHPQSVEAILKFDEDTILTGSSDGLIRIISILPNKMKGVIGEHADFPIERMAFNSDHRVLGTASHDHILKIWDIKYLYDEEMDVSEEKDFKVGNRADNKDSDTDPEYENGKAAKPRKKRKKQDKSGTSFFKDLW